MDGRERADGGGERGTKQAEREERNVIKDQIVYSVRIEYTLVTLTVAQKGVWFSHMHSHSSAQRRWEYENYCMNVMPMENEMLRMQEVRLVTEHTCLSDRRVGLPYSQKYWK